METLVSLREGIASGRLKGCTELKISDGLDEFPKEILSLSASLELLVLSGNQLRSLPPEFAQLKQLKIAFFNNNKFESFPATLANCPKLEMISFKSNGIQAVPEGVLSPVVRWLILTDNQIGTLPDDIGRLTRLQKLMLAGNRLRSLPEALSKCTNLELIRLSANSLTSLPAWLFSLPKLTWLAYAGNPFCETTERLEKQRQSAAQIPSIDERELVLGEVLGQGASGVIYRSEWKGETVAVKLFKGEITSDGLPVDEMRACLGAGAHPNLVSVVGRLERDKETVGLVFSFISDDYQNLGGPPSLSSCTRDTYDEEVSFTLPVVLRILGGVSSAVQQLHKQGITHGDLYAHNILTNAVGDSILGDFGAASFFDIADREESEALMRLESRAFGCLIEDLLTRCCMDEANKTDVLQLQILQRIQTRCFSSAVADRLLMTEICKLLSE